MNGKKLGSPVLKGKGFWNVNERGSGDDLGVQWWRNLGWRDRIRLIAGAMELIPLLLLFLLFVVGLIWAIF